MSACPRCGKSWENGDCDTTVSRRGRCQRVSVETLCSNLRSAHEKLCVAQVHARWPGHRARLQEAIDIIEQVGSFSCPDWSKYRMPTVEEP